MGAGFGGSVLALVDRKQMGPFMTDVGQPVLFCSTADGPYAR